MASCRSPQHRKSPPPLLGAHSRKHLLTAHPPRPCFVRRHLSSVGYGGCTAREAHEEVDPTLLLDTARRLQAVRWAPHDANLVAAAATDDALVQLFDLQYTQVELVPTCALTARTCSPVAENATPDA